MKKLFLSTTLLVGLLSIQAHADYVSPTTSVASQAAQYSVMDINSLIKAAKRVSLLRSSILQPSINKVKISLQMNDRPLLGTKPLRIKVFRQLS